MMGNKSIDKCPYNVSQDYSEAYKALKNGYDLIAYVDYGFSESICSRDICRIRRFREYDIPFGVRGLEYGGVYIFDKEDGEEFELFQKECIRLNASFILPN